MLDGSIHIEEVPELITGAVHAALHVKIYLSERS